MNYLDSPRLTFAGEFQADVSTVNNDVRHHDNATVEERCQRYSEGSTENAWWNPIGGTAFWLLPDSVEPKLEFVRSYLRPEEPPDGTGRKDKP